MDTTSDFNEAGMVAFITKYEQMISLTNSSTTLARATSASTGKFSLSISPVDSVVIVGYADSEQQPFYYNDKIVGGRANSAFILDMSRGGCFRSPVGPVTK